MYLDEQWNEVIEQKDCIEKIKFSKANRTLTIPLNGGWSSVESGIINHVVRPHVWFIAFSDCNKEFT